MPAIQVVSLKDFGYIVPEMLLTAWGLVLLLLDVCWLKHRPSAERRKLLGALALVGLAVAVAWMLAPTLGPAASYYKAMLGGGSSSGGLLPNEQEGVTAGADLDPSIFFGTIAGDVLTRRMNLVVAVMMALVVCLSVSWDFTEHWGEYFALVFWAGVGMMFLIAAEELLTLFLTLEMMTLCLYLATALETNRRRSAEAGLKYFVYGSVSSALFLFGLSLVYGLTGGTQLDTIATALHGPVSREIGLSGNVAGVTAVLLIMVGFGFKVAAVPFHMWAPDAYEGAPAPVTAWIASGSKLASFIAMMKVFVHALGPWSRMPSSLLSPGWIGVVAVIAAVTMTYGNFAALAQRNLKRLLAYSSIAHAGYMLVGVLAAAVSMKIGSQPPVWNPQAAGAVLFYLVVYGFSTIGAFALAAWLSREKGRENIDDLNGLGTRSPGLAVCVVILMLSLIGVPPLGGFFGKLYMFMEALNAGEHGRITLLWLVALALANSVVSAFYYVRVLKAMYFRTADEHALAPASPAIAWPIVLPTVVVIAFGIFPTPLLEAMGQASLPMLTSPGAQGISDWQRAYALPKPGREPQARPGPPADEAKYLEQMKEMLKGSPAGGAMSGAPAAKSGPPGGGGGGVPKKKGGAGKKKGGGFSKKGGAGQQGGGAPKKSMEPPK